MTDITWALEHWVRWRGRTDRREIEKETGNKRTTIEYRLMVEAGTVDLDKRTHWALEQLVEDVDLVWSRIRQWYPDEMDAVLVYYKRRKSFRAVRMEFKVSQHKSRLLVKSGENMLAGGLASIAGFQG